MSEMVAGAFPLVYGTAHVALAHRGGLRPGETLLVLGAAGGVGLAAVEIGKRMGARVIAAASTDEKLALAQAQGADECINYNSEDLRARIKALTADRGADVIFDPVGGDAFDTAVRRIAWEGRYLVIGFASGRIPALPANIALLKNASLVGVFWGAYMQHDPAIIRQSLQQLLAWYAEGNLRPHIGQIYPLEKAADASARSQPTTRFGQTGSYHRLTAGRQQPTRPVRPLVRICVLRSIANSRELWYADAW